MPYKMKTKYFARIFDAHTNTCFLRTSTERWKNDFKIVENLKTFFDAVISGVTIPAYA